METAHNDRLPGGCDFSGGEYRTKSRSIIFLCMIVKHYFMRTTVEILSCIMIRLFVALFPE